MRLKNITQQQGATPALVATPKSFNDKQQTDGGGPPVFDSACQHVADGNHTGGADHDR